MRALSMTFGVHNPAVPVHPTLTSTSVEVVPKYGSRKPFALEKSWYQRYIACRGNSILQLNCERSEEPCRRPFFSSCFGCE
jgi:hypothetical protein